jgi:hypothetical protein
MFRFGTGGALVSALIALVPTDCKISNVHPGSRPRADFLAQLIAVKTKLPQMRVRRRAEPEEATAAYGVLGRSPTLLGRALSRSL